MIDGAQRLLELAAGDRLLGSTIGNDLSLLCRRERDEPRKDQLGVDIGGVRGAFDGATRVHRQQPTADEQIGAIVELFVDIAIQRRGHQQV
ncbi:Uncharacterised protein [Mycobacteroides abscessus subsp. massiliense]|nr:Uncharacterised protein [Mycobacteroides abscessus subsp. massiliense]